MKCCEKCNECLTSPYIALQQSMHAMLALHILEDLKEADLLLIGQRKWYASKEFFYIFCIDRHKEAFPFGGSLQLELTLDSLLLEDK